MFDPLSYASNQLITKVQNILVRMAHGLHA